MSDNDSQYGSDTDLSTVSPDEAHNLIDQAVARGIREGAARAAAAASAASAEDRAVALDLLTNELGGREQALERLALQPDISDLASRIAAEKAERQRLAEAQQQADWEASPEGRKHAAQAALERQAQAKRDADLARALLREDARYDEGLISRMTDEEVVDAAGIANPDPEPEPFLAPQTDREKALDQFERDYWTLTNQQRRERCEELGIPAETVHAQMLAAMRADPRFN